MDVATFFRTFGWQISIVALIGTLIVGWLKKPVRELVTKKSSEEELEKNFDVVAFILGFCVALILGIIYSAMATNLGWVAESGSFGVYVYNIFATWTGQILFYQIWKKLGVKRLATLVWNFLKNLAKNILDKNKDGVITVDEAFKTIEGLVKNGTLSLNQVLDGIACAAPSVIDDLLSYVGDEVGDDAKTDPKANVAKLHDILSALTDKIPVEQIGDVVGVLLEALTEEMNDAAKNATISEAAISEGTRVLKGIPTACVKSCNTCGYYDCGCRNCPAIRTCDKAPLQRGVTCPLDDEPALEPVQKIKIYSSTPTVTQTIEKLPTEADIGKVKAPTRPTIKF